VRFEAVLFDWDGTLLDSAEACYRVYRNMFGEEGIAFDRATFARTYSPNWRLTYQALGLPPDRWPVADRRYLELWRAEAVGLRDGASELLGSIRSDGVAMGVVTSGDRSRVFAEVERHGLATFFAAIVCGDDTERKKPHPEGLLIALGRVGIDASDAAYVGDSPEDIQMAKEAGVFSVGVHGGFPNAEALRAAGPSAWAEDLNDLRRVLALDD
jgi:HAD superfamily hydrolase (TIGR01549 family)